MPMPDPFQRQNRPLVGIVLGALVILGAVGLMEWRRRPHPAKNRETVFAATGLPLAPMPPAAARPPSAVTSQPGVLDSTDFDKLVELFKGTSEVPAAREFAKEFQAEPALEKEWDDFEADQKSGDPKDTLQTFAKRISDNPEFRQLVAKYSQEPGFRDVALRLSQDPKIKEAMQHVIASARVAPPALRAGAVTARATAGRGAPGAAQGAGAFGTRNPQFARGGLGSQVDTAGASSGASGAKGGQAGGGDADLSGGPQKVNLGGGAGGVGEKAGAPPSGGPGGDAHDVSPKLEGPTNAPSEDMDKELKKWLARHGLDPNDFLGDRSSGIWDKCFLLGKLAKCDEACENQPTTISTLARAYCSKPSGDLPYWEACKQAYGNDELRCIRECQDQDPPCTVEDDAIVRYCRKEVDCDDAAAVRSAFESIPAACGRYRTEDPGGVQCADGGPPPLGPSGARPRAILGYERGPDGKLKVDRDEKKIVQAVYKLFKELGDVRKVAAALKKPPYSLTTREDFNNKRGGPLDSNSIAQLLKRDQYTGKGGFPQIISPALYRQVQEMRKEHGAKGDR